MDRTWTVEIDGKKHQIEVSYPVVLQVDEDNGKTLQEAKIGNVLVDGNEVVSWPPINIGGLSDLPVKSNFDIAGKHADVRKTGFFTQKLSLFVEGKEVKG